MTQPQQPQMHHVAHADHWHLKELTRSTRLGMFAIAGIVLYVVLDIVAQALHPQQNPIRDAESNLALGSFGWIMALNFVVRGLLSLAVVAGLQKALVPAARSQVGAILIEIWAVGSFWLALFPTDAPGQRTLHGLIHALVALIAFFAAAAGELLISRRLAADPRWLQLRQPLATIAVFALAMLVVVLIAGERLAAGTQAGGIFGLVERVFLALVLLWMLVVALRLVQLHPAAQPA